MNRPCLYVFAGIMLSIHVLGAVAMAILFATGFNVAETDVGNTYLDVRHDENFLRGLAWENRNDADDIIQVR